MSQINETNIFSRAQSCLTRRTYTMSESQAFWNSRQELDNEDKNLSRGQKCCNFVKRNCFWIAAFIGLAFFMILMFTPLKSKMINYVDENVFYIRNWSQKYYWSFNIIVFFSNTVYVLSLQPGKMVQNVAVSFISQDLFRSVSIIYISNLVANLCIFVVVKFFMYKTCMKKWKNDKKYILMNNMVNENPWKASFIIWSFFVPYAIKAMILSLTNQSYLQFFVGSLPSTMLMCVMFCMIGYEIKDQNDLNMSWGGNGDMQWSKIVDIIITVSFLTFTMIFSTYMYVDFKTKLRELEIQDEEAIANQNMQNQ